MGMVIGAGWAGARAMSSTSGPGVSLMSEFTGLGYYAEVPAVIFDIQRAGPSTGLPTRTAQGDVLSTAVLSHGDAKHPLLLPASVGECYDFAIRAFDLAERLQTPVFVLSDLDLGMNTWMSDPFPYPEGPIDRGKRLTPEKLREIGQWGRYLDVDGDGIPYRTAPLDGMPAYFCRGSGHNERAQYSERPDDYVNNLARLARKFDTARSLVPPPEIVQTPDARVGIVAFGTSHWATLEARDQLANEAQLPCSYLRLRAYPFTPELADFVARHDRVYVIEQNRDGQLLALMRMEMGPALIERLRSIRHFNGLPIDARSISDSVLELEGRPRPQGARAGAGRISAGEAGRGE
jgi:2-oxoglutarate ferredoxin oxidoreductase subunit alpha